MQRIDFMAQSVGQHKCPFDGLRRINIKPLGHVNSLPAGQFPDLLPAVRQNYVAVLFFIRKGRYLMLASFLFADAVYNEHIGKNAYPEYEDQIILFAPKSESFRIGGITDGI